MRTMPRTFAHHASIRHIGGIDVVPFWLGGPRLNCGLAAGRRSYVPAAASRNQNRGFTSIMKVDALDLHFFYYRRLKPA